MTSLPRLPPRVADAHKGDFGRVQIIGGSAELPGAPALAALAALRGGAGLVQIVCPPEIRHSVAGLAPCATFGSADSPTPQGMGHPTDRFRPTVRAVGPGWGEQVPADELRRILQDRSTPIVLDADGLNLLARIDQWWTLTRQDVVLTPHPGEMKRLLARTALANASLDRSALCQEAAALGHAVIVLKGHHTVVSDGGHVYVNNTGNPGMATGGSGDVLTGVIAALIGQGLSPYDAACLGVHVHGLSGDLAARELGQIAMIATDIIDFLPQALQTYGQS